MVFDVDLRPEFSAPEVAEDPVIVETYLIGNENYPGDWSYDRPNDYIPRTPNGIGPENMPNGGPKVFWAIYLMYSAYSKYQSQIKQAEKAYKKPALEQQRLTPIDKETFQKFLLYLEQSSWDQDKKDRVKEIDDLILEYKEQQRSNSREQK